MKETTTRQVEKYPGNRADGGKSISRAASVARLRRFTRLLDEALRIPGTQHRIGLEALLGLIPGLGDVAGGLLAAYGLLVAVRIGVPPAVLLHMLLNIGVDTVTGAVPLIGDLFDFIWKANSRNLALLERFLDKPADTHVASRRLLIMLGLALLVMCGVTLWLAVVSLRALFGLFA